MKRLKCDLHVHTEYSFDSAVPMQRYVDVALEKNIDVVCFTDHIECNFRNTFDSFRYGERAEEFYALKQKYDGKLKLLLGFEVGEPNMHPKEMNFLRSLQPDEIIGSVHYPAAYENLPESLSDCDYERLYDRHVLAMVEYGGFDILGHWNMLRKYHENFEEDKTAVRRIMRMCVKNGIIPEINTSVLKHAGNYKIDSWVLEYYAETGGKFVTVNSDAHRAEDLYSGCDEAIAVLPDSLGLCYFENGKPIAV